MLLRLVMQLVGRFSTHAPQKHSLEFGVSTLLNPRRTGRLQGILLWSLLLLATVIESTAKILVVIRMLAIVPGKGSWSNLCLPTWWLVLVTGILCLLGVLC